MRNIYKSTYKWEGIKPTSYAVSCHIELPFEVELISNLLRKHLLINQSIILRENKRDEKAKNTI